MSAKENLEATQQIRHGKYVDGLPKSLAPHVSYVLDVEL